MGKTIDRDLKAMFAAGAYSAYVDMGMQEKDAEAVAEEMCKLAAKRYVVDDDDDDEGDTWWSRNRGWLLPAAIGAGTFLMGSNAASSEYAIPGGGHFENTGRYLWNKFKKLFGYTDNPIWKSLTDVGTRPVPVKRLSIAEMSQGKPSGLFDLDGPADKEKLKTQLNTHEYLSDLPRENRNRALRSLVSFTK